MFQHFFLLHFVARVENKMVWEKEKKMIIIIMIIVGWNSLHLGEGGANIVESCFWAKLHRRNIWQNTSVLFGAWNFIIIIINLIELYQYVNLAWATTQCYT